MILDLDSTGERTQFEADVCVIGSGAAGLAIANEFLASGTRVLVLETGGSNREERADALNQGRNTGIPNSSLCDGRVRVLGGTTDIWPGACIPLVETDFAIRPWVPYSGWPIGLDVVRPYYERAARLFKIAMETFERDLWEVLGVQGPKLDEALLTHAMNVFSPRPNRYLGKMLSRSLKGSRNVDVLLHATATELVTTEGGGAVDHVVVKSLSGRSATIRARVFAACCGGFENARLLLLSRRTDPNGVGNGFDLVGRFFQDHPSGRIATIVSDRPQLLQKAYGVSFEGFPPRPRPYPKIRMSPGLQREKQVLNCSVNVVWDIAAESGEQGLLQVFQALRGLRTPLLPRAEVAKIVRDLPGTVQFLGTYLMRRASLTPPTSIWLLSMAEQCPNPDSRIRLSEEVDVLGSPRIELDWRLTEMDRQTHATMAKTVQREFGRLGLGSVEPAEWLTASGAQWQTNLFGTFHPTGTTRMANDPRRGVVDAQCRVHGVPNLYVCGSSVFPTSGYANPTFTLTALAIRTADHLKELLQ